MFVQLWAAEGSNADEDEKGFVIANHSHCLMTSNFVATDWMLADATVLSDRAARV